MIEINLIPDVKQELIRAQRTRSFVVTTSIFIGVGTLGLAALLAFYVFAVQGVRNTLADDAIEKGSAQLAEVEDLSKVLTIQNQLDKIQELNADKKIDSRVFEVLAAILPPAPNQVQVSDLSIDAEENLMVIEGQTPTFDTLEIFQKTIDGAVVTYAEDGEEVSLKLAEDITVSDFSYGQDTSGVNVLRFTLSFTYPSELFAATTPSFVIKLTNEGNVTDSYLGVPRSIFVEGGAQ